MPTSFYTRRATNNVPVPSGDYVSVYTPIYRRLSILNNGPGNLWMSFIPDTPPTTAAANAIEIPANTGYVSDEQSYSPLQLGVQLTADAASTSASVSIG